jgi:hypothetical protein
MVFTAVLMKPLSFLFLVFAFNGTSAQTPIWQPFWLPSPGHTQLPL